MRYTYAVAYQSAIPWYIHYAIGYPYDLITRDELTPVQQEILDQMPKYPNEGCSRVVDGVLLFNM